MDVVKIGTFIKAQRTEFNMTQKDLAQKIGCTDKAISRWETGKGLPDMSFIIPLSKELNVSINELLMGEKLICETANPEETEVVTEIIRKKQFDGDFEEQLFSPPYRSVKKMINFRVFDTSLFHNSNSLPIFVPLKNGLESGIQRRAPRSQLRRTEN